MLRAGPLVAEFEKYKEQIKDLIAPKDRDADFATRIQGIGAFPVLVHLGEGEIGIAHHMQFGTTNPVTKRTVPSRLVVGLDGDGVAKEFCGFGKEICGKGKTYNPGKIARLVDHPEEAEGIGLSQTGLAIRSFTFCT